MAVIETEIYRNRYIKRRDSTYIESLNLFQMRQAKTQKFIDHTHVELLNSF